MSRIRPALILAVFAAVTLPLMPVQQLFVWTWPSMAKRFPMHYHRILLRILGVRLKLVGSPAPHGPFLIASNHVSWLDIVVLSAVAPLSFIAKREIDGWPFFGSLARLQRTLFVDRERRHATGNSHGELRRRLEAGDRLVLFPEGTSSDGVTILPFKSSLFGAAAEAGVVVQPVTIAYTGHRNMPMNRRLRPFYAWYGDMELPRHLWQALATGPIEVTLICHETISPGGHMNRKTIARHAETVVRRSLIAALHHPGKIG